MGRVRKKKHPSEDHKTNNSAGIAPPQKRLTSQRESAHFSQLDLREYALPVIKEVGKALYPPAALPIEVLYELYSHVDSIREVSSAIKQGDYKRASTVLLKDAVKEAAVQALGGAESPLTNAASTAISSAATQVPQTESSQIMQKVADGSVKGVVEATNEKIVKKVSDRRDDK